MYLIISFFIVISVGTHQLHISGVGATGVFDWLNGTILCQCRMFVWTRYRTSVHKVAPINLLGPVGVIIELSAFMRRWKAACVWSRNNFVADVWCLAMVQLDATNASKLLLDQLEERILPDQSKNASKHS